MYPHASECTRAGAPRTETTSLDFEFAGEQHEPAVTTDGGRMIRQLHIWQCHPHSSGGGGTDRHNDTMTQ